MKRKRKGNSWCKKDLRYISNTHHVWALFGLYFKQTVKRNIIRKKMNTEYLIISKLSLYCKYNNGIEFLFVNHLNKILTDEIT